jgi:protein subunit release factor B
MTDKPKQLLFSLTRKDFTWQTFRAGGKGGQNQNKVESGVRCIHPPSGARGEARDSRDQWRNKQSAFVRCL